MLTAEIHGKVVEAAQDSEDQLTSAIFGHLRYLGPNSFWPDLFLRAHGARVDGPQMTMNDYLSNLGVDWVAFERVDVSFWPSHDVFGTPDLVVFFTGSKATPLTIVIEVKLWAGKSGSGENDQLLRHLRLLDRLEELQPPPPRGALLRNAVTALVYVCPVSPLPAMMETAELNLEARARSVRLFGLEWQDILEAAECAAVRSAEMPAMILSDVAYFLRRRGLEYFRGFRRCLDEYGAGGGFFYNISFVDAAPDNSSEGFAGFGLVERFTGAENGSFYNLSISFLGFQEAPHLSGIAGAFYF